MRVACRAGGEDDFDVFMECVKAKSHHTQARLNSQQGTQYTRFVVERKSKYFSAVTISVVLTDDSSDFKTMCVQSCGQPGHKPRKPGMLGDFPDCGKLREASGNSVQHHARTVTNKIVFAYRSNICVKLGKRDHYDLRE